MDLIFENCFFSFYFWKSSSSLFQYSFHQYSFDHYQDYQVYLLMDFWGFSKEWLLRLWLSSIGWSLSPWFLTSKKGLSFIFRSSLGLKILISFLNLRGRFLFLDLTCNLISRKSYYQTIKLQPIFNWSFVFYIKNIELDMYDINYVYYTLSIYKNIYILVHLKKC